MTGAEIRAAIRSYLEANPAATDEQVIAATSCSPSTLFKVRRALRSTATRIAPLRMPARKAGRR